MVAGRRQGMDVQIPGEGITTRMAERSKFGKIGCRKGTREESGMDVPCESDC